MGLACEYCLYYYNWRGGGGRGGFWRERSCKKIGSNSQLLRSWKFLQAPPPRKYPVHNNPASYEGYLKKEKKTTATINWESRHCVHKRRLGGGGCKQINQLSLHISLRDFQIPSKIEQPASETFQYLLLFPAPCFVDISTFTIFT